MPARSHSVGRQSHSRVSSWCSCERMGTGQGQHLLFAWGTPKSHSPNFSTVSRRFTCGTDRP